MKRVVVATIKPWNIKNAVALKKRLKVHKVSLITRPEDLTVKKLRNLNPDYVFFPHWSWIIDEEIYKNFECIVFHMTDLPYGRGGSPLQNLIVRGHNRTKISAIKVVKGLDAGPIYQKRDLSLEGAADDIYKRASDIIFERMIPKMLKSSKAPKPQKGKATVFKRRKPSDGNISGLKELKDVYDYIRMLDAPTYPKAFLESPKLKIEFSKAVYKKDHVEANVRIEVRK